MANSFVGGGGQLRCETTALASKIPTPLAVLALSAKQPARPERGRARRLVGLQVPRTCEAASWEPNEVYEVLHETSVISEEGQEETFNRFLKPAAPPDSGNGVAWWVVPHASYQRRGSGGDFQPALEEACRAA